MKSKRSQAPQSSPDADEAAASPRIIGGHLRGRKLLFNPQPHVRPMKDRVREALFNLIGPAVKGVHAIDLFAGTGALGFEALSRGASGATFAERHFPTADLIKKNAAELGVGDRATIIPANVLLWSRRMPQLPHTPWLVFVSPPWDMFVDAVDELMSLVDALISSAPPASQFVVESDERFDVERLPRAGEWDTREYPPAIVSILRLPAERSEQAATNS